MGGSPSGQGGFGNIPNVQDLFPGVPVPQIGVAGGNMAPPGFQHGGFTPAPTGGTVPQGLEPWNYQVPNPELPQPPPSHVDFEDFPGGRGGGGRGRRRDRRRKRRRDRFFDELAGGGRPTPFWKTRKKYYGGAGTPGQSGTPGGGGSSGNGSADI